MGQPSHCSPHYTQQHQLLCSGPVTAPHIIHSSISCSAVGQSLLPTLYTAASVALQSAVGQSLLPTLYTAASVALQSAVGQSPAPIQQHQLLCSLQWASHRPLYNSISCSAVCSGPVTGPYTTASVALQSAVGQSPAPIQQHQLLCSLQWASHRPLYNSISCSAVCSGPVTGPYTTASVALQSAVGQSPAPIQQHQLLCSLQWASHRPLYNSISCSAVCSGPVTGPYTTASVALQSAVGQSPAPIQQHQLLCSLQWASHRPLYNSISCSAVCSGPVTGPYTTASVALQSAVGQSPAPIQQHQLLCSLQWASHWPLYNSISCSAVCSGPVTGPYTTASVALQSAVGQLLAPIQQHQLLCIGTYEQRAHCVGPLFITPTTQ